MKCCPGSCGRCGRSLEGVRPQGDPIRDQVAELPPIVVEITEYLRYAVCCPGCGTVTVGERPTGVGVGDFGPRLRAFLALMSGRYRLSRREVVELSWDFFELPISLGSVAGICLKVGKVLEDPVRALEEKMRGARVAHLDDTSWYEKSRRAYLWVKASGRDSLYRIAASKKMEVVADLLGKGFGGRVVTDRAASFGLVPSERRQVCWSHILRDFQAVEDRGGAWGWLGTWGVDLAHRVFSRWHAYKRGDLSWGMFRRRIAPLEREMMEILERGRNDAEGETRGMCRHLWGLRRSLFLFARVRGVEPTNNRSERDLRPGVLWRRGSFGSQSPSGSRFVERMLTVRAGCRRYRVPLFAYLTAVCGAADEGKPIPRWWRWRARDGPRGPRSRRRRR